MPNPFEPMFEAIAELIITKIPGTISEKIFKDKNPNFVKKVLIYAVEGMTILLLLLLFVGVFLLFFG